MPQSPLLSCTCFPDGLGSGIQSRAWHKLARAPGSHFCTSPGSEHGVQHLSKPHPGLNHWKSAGRLPLLQLAKCKKINDSLSSSCASVDDSSEFTSHLQPHRAQAQEQINFSCTFSFLSSIWSGAWMPQSCQDIIIRKKKKKSGIEAQR